MPSSGPILTLVSPACCLFFTDTLKLYRSFLLPFLSLWSSLLEPACCTTRHGSTLVAPKKEDEAGDAAFEA